MLFTRPCYGSHHAGVSSRPKCIHEPTKKPKKGKWETTIEVVK